MDVFPGKFRNTLHLTTIYFFTVELNSFPAHFLSLFRYAINMDKESFRQTGLRRLGQCLCLHCIRLLVIYLSKKRNYNVSEAKQSKQMWRLLLVFRTRGKSRAKERLWSQPWLGLTKKSPAVRNSTQLPDSRSLLLRWRSYSR